MEKSSIESNQRKGECERKFEGKRESNMTREMMTIVINYKESERSETNDRRRNQIQLTREQFSRL